MRKKNNFDSFLECLHHRTIYNNGSKIVKGNELSRRNALGVFSANIGGRKLTDKTL